MFCRTIIVNLELFSIQYVPLNTGLSFSRGLVTSTCNYLQSGESEVAKASKPTQHVSTWAGVSRFRGFIRELDMAALSSLTLTGATVAEEEASEASVPLAS